MTDIMDVSVYIGGVVDDWVDEVLVDELVDLEEE